MIPPLTPPNWTKKPRHSAGSWALHHDLARLARSDRRVAQSRTGKNGWVDDPYRLLITHAEHWAAKSRRPLDPELLETALSLRDSHDQRPGTSWPAGSVAELMTVRWPGHGPLDPPDIDALVATLETFWRFLRATGRMASDSVEVKALTREAARSIATMRERLSDPAAYGASKSLLAFGREIGISLEDAESVEDANARFAAIAEAWNAQPQAERLARSPGPAGAGSKASAQLTEAANQLLAGVDLTAYAASHGMVGTEDADEDEDEDAIPVQDPRVVAEQVRRSPFLERIRSLVEWIGPAGRPVTQSGVLRPAVAREAIADLGLDDWLLTQLGEPPPTWRSAGEHLGLDRLYLAAVQAGMLEVRSTKVLAVPEGTLDDLDWVLKGISALVVARDRGAYAASAASLLGVLLALEFGEARTVGDLVAWWRHAPTNPYAQMNTGRLDTEQAAAFSETLDRLSEAAVRWTLGYWRDTDIIREKSGKLSVTELGLDLLRVLIRLHELEEDEAFEDGDASQDWDN